LDFPLEQFQNESRWILQTRDRCRCYQILHKISLSNVDWMNSIKLKVSLLAKHRTYQTLHEGINVSVVILPIAKYKLLNQGIQHSAVVDVKFFVIFFRRKRME